MRKKKETVIPESREELFKAAMESQDPAEKEKFLLKLVEKDPSCLAAQRELLMLGNLARRNGKDVDYSVIKCYLFHAFEYPEKHAEEEQKRMIREIFDHPQLKLCLSLTKDQKGFVRYYLEDLCGEYLRVFIEGDKQRSGTFFGFQLPGRRIKALSVPCAKMLENMLSSPFMSEEEKTLLSGVFYRAARQFLGDSREMDRLMGSEICGLIR